MNTDGAVTGAVRIWLRTEGVAVATLSVLLYGHSGGSWWMFVALLLTPDLSMLPYLLSPRAGGFSYNAAHSYLAPLGLAIFAVAFYSPGILPFLYIWTAHIGLDRALGYGLKYPTAFTKTHLGSLRGGSERRENAGQGNHRT